MENMTNIRENAKTLLMGFAFAMYMMLGSCFDSPALVRCRKRKEFEGNYGRLYPSTQIRMENQVMFFINWYLKDSLPEDFWSQTTYVGFYPHDGNMMEVRLWNEKYCLSIVLAYRGRKKPDIYFNLISCEERRSA